MGTGRTLNEDQAHAGRALKQVAKGGALFSVGAVAANVIQLIVGILVVRLVSRTDYGLISFSFVAANVLVSVLALGFPSGLAQILARQVDRSRDSVGRTIGTALALAGGLSLVVTWGFHVLAAMIARAIGEPGAAEVLRAFAFMIPPLTMLFVLNGMFRGLGDVRGKVIFTDLGLNGLRLCLLGAVALLGLGFHGVIRAYVAAVWLAFGAYVLYAAIRVLRHYPLRIDTGAARELLTMSLPLLAADIATSAAGWGGVLVLGFYQPAGEVGLLNAPLRLGTLATLPLTALTFLYLPIAAAWAQSPDRARVGHLYLSATKWACLLLIPILGLFILDARFVVVTLFGPPYADSAEVLQVLAVGYAVHTILGPNGATLVSLGRPRSVLVSSLLGSVATLAGAVLAAPRYGAVGVAVATTVGYCLSNLYLTLVLTKALAGVQFATALAGTLLPAALLGIVPFLVTALVAPGSSVVHLLAFVASAVLTLVGPLLMRKFDASDLELLAALERRISRRQRISSWLAAKGPR